MASSSNTDTDIIVQCPHCDDLIQILSINCGIFRHAVLKSSLQQINPHESEDKCNEFIASNSVYGCAKPFRIINCNGELKTEKCNYI
jgi:hypothetical protein